MCRPDERGFGLIIAMFMTLMVSALAAGMAFVARSETLSSHSYTTMGQARYAAESGLAAAANYLLSDQYAAVAPGTAGDAIANYTLTLSPVRLAAGGEEVLLSTEDNGTNSKYSAQAVITQFVNASSGTLQVNNAIVRYGARAKLLAMRRITDATSGTAQTLQAWEITGVGRLPGSGSAEVEVTAIIERHPVSIYRYAAFATKTGCGALSFAGGANTNSYNSLVGPTPTSNTGGDVGTNGNLTVSGTGTQIYGTLSTPRTGVGTCTTSNVTAMTIDGKAKVHGGLVDLPQIQNYPTPEEPPAPPTSEINFTKAAGCAGATSCTVTGVADVTITPTTNPYPLGNVVINGQANLVLSAGTYVFNSIKAEGGSKIQIAGNGPVIIKIAGAGSLTPNTIPISLASENSIVNTTFKPENLQFIYGGQGTVYVAGGNDTSALVYAPNATVEVKGNSDFYGAIVGGQVTVAGASKLHYDTNLINSVVTTGSPVMTTFTWQAF